MSSFERLTAQEMLAVSRSWVAPRAPERELLESTPETAELMPLLIERHQRLFEALPKSTEELDQLTAQAAELDRRHDNLRRGLSDRLTSAALLSGGFSTRKRLLEIRDTLLPHDETTTKPADKERGPLTITEAQVTADIRALLRQFTFSGGNLEALIDELINLGQQLSVVEARRTQLLNSFSEENAGPLLEARHGWVHIVDPLVTHIAASSLPPATIKELLAPLHDALRNSEHHTAHRSTPAIHPNVPPPELPSPNDTNDPPVQDSTGQFPEPTNEDPHEAPTRPAPPSPCPDSSTETP